MTNYNNDTLEMINGETPKQKHDTLTNIFSLLENIVTPRRGSEEEGWNIDDVVNYIIDHKLIKNNN